MGTDEGVNKKVETLESTPTLFSNIMVLHSSWWKI